MGDWIDRLTELAKFSMSVEISKTHGEFATRSEPRVGSVGETTAALRVRVVGILRARSAWALIGAFVYPALYLWPALSSRRYHMRSPVADPTLLTDLDGAVRLAYVFQQMRFPWSASMVTAYPTGEMIWRWQNLTQAVQLSAIWVFTRFAAPVSAVNLLVLVGWALTGYVVYRLTLRLGSSRLTAAAAGVLAQFLPAIPVMAANYTSYVFVCVPILTVWAAAEFAAAPTDRRFRLVVLSLGFSAFFDAYWFFFTLSAVLIMIAIRRRGIASWFAQSSGLMKIQAIGAAAAPLVMVVGVIVLDQLSGGSSFSRTLGIAEVGLIDAGLRPLASWVDSSVEGVGVLVAVLACVRVVRKRRTLGAIESGVVVATVFFFLISTDTSFASDVLSVGPLAHVARFAMPGVRFFQRSGLIAEALLCIIAMRELEDLVARRESIVTRTSIAALTGVALVLSLQPLSGRAVQRITDDYEPLRRMLVAAGDPVVAALPYVKMERSWMELSFLDVPSLNPLYSAQPVIETNLAASQGPEALAAYLASRGVTHLFFLDGDAGLPVHYALEAPRFVELATMPTNGFEAGDMTFGVYEVHPQPGDTFCGSCGPGTEMDLIEGVESDDGFSALETLSNDVQAWWLHGETGTITLTTRQLPQFDGTVHLRFGADPCGTPRRFSVTHGEQTWRLAIQTTGPTELSIPVSAETVGLPIEITAGGEPCRIAADPRPFMLQMYFPTLS